MQFERRTEVSAHGRASSDPTPEKPPNQAGRPVAEAVEGRGPAKGSPPKRNVLRTQSRAGAPSALEGVRPVAGNIPSCA